MFSIMLAPTLDLLSSMREDVAAHPDVTAASHVEHDLIMSAVEAGEAERAQAAMLAHIDRFVESGDRLMADATAEQLTPISTLGRAPSAPS